MKKLKVPVVAFTLLLPIPVFAASAAVVADAASLQAALDAGATTVTIKEGTKIIDVKQTLKYIGTSALNIEGNGAEIVDAGIPDGDPIFYVSQGADVSIANLALKGPGGYSINTLGSLKGGKGIYVQVPASRTGVVSLTLTEVSVSGTGNHGVHVSDCSLQDACGGGQGGGGDGSAASVHVTLESVTIDGVGFAKQDADGLRVDDRGPGDIVLTAKNSRFINVGADGIELDEGNEGSVQVLVDTLTVESNGAYCFDVDGDGPFDPIATDPACNDDNEPDVDDGFDIDEAGPGGISGTLTNLTIVNNYDEGLDFDTDGEGENNFVKLDIQKVVASGNGDEAIKISEEGNASVDVTLSALNIAGDVEVEEEGEGNLSVSISASNIDDDLKLSTEGAGKGTVLLTDTTVAGEKDFKNITEL